MMQDYKIEHWDGPRCVAQADNLAAFLAVILPDDWSNFAEKLPGRCNLSAHVALDGEGRLIGLKLGYERNRGVFNSWMGGVAPEARGQGLAAALMAAQHAWAKEAGLPVVSTKVPYLAALIQSCSVGFWIGFPFLSAGTRIVTSLPQRALLSLSEFSKI